MKKVVAFICIGVVFAVNQRFPRKILFLNNLINPSKYKSDGFLISESKDNLNIHKESDIFFTEEDLNNINNFVNDIKAGVYGNKHKKDMENLSIENSSDHDVKSVKELLKFKDERLDKTLNQVFDLSQLPTEDAKDFDWEEFEKKVSQQGRKEKMSTEELKSMVHSLFRKKGLLKENFKVLEISGLKLNWRQSLSNLEIWFAVGSDRKSRDYEIKFLPSSLRIEYKSEVILQKNLFGKVECDGCFWTMYKNPLSGKKYININLTKRKPKFNNMWDQPFN